MTVLRWHSKPVLPIKAREQAAEVSQVVWCRPALCRFVLAACILTRSNSRVG